MPPRSSIPVHVGDVVVHPMLGRCVVDRLTETCADLAPLDPALRTRARLTQWQVARLERVS